MKGELLEGGIRVPVLVRWPARIAAGLRTGQLAATTDWLPTLAGRPRGARRIPTTRRRHQPVAAVTGAVAHRSRARFTGVYQRQ
jgi:arylsulfatase A-like enzyme